MQTAKFLKRISKAMPAQYYTKEGLFTRVCTLRFKTWWYPYRSGCINIGVPRPLNPSVCATLYVRISIRMLDGFWNGIQVAQHSDSDMKYCFEKWLALKQQKREKKLCSTVLCIFFVEKTISISYGLHIGKRSTLILIKLNATISYCTWQQ